MKKEILLNSVFERKGYHNLTIRIEQKANGNILVCSSSAEKQFKSVDDAIESLKSDAGRIYDMGLYDISKWLIEVVEDLKLIPIN